MSYLIQNEVIKDLAALENSNTYNKEEKLLYTVKETAYILGCNVHLVYNLVNKGLLPALKLGSLKIRKASIEKFLDKYDGMDLTNLDNIVALNGTE